MTAAKERVMIKHILATLLVMITLAMAAACGDDDNDASDDTTTDGTETQSADESPDSAGDGQDRVSSSIFEVPVSIVPSPGFESIPRGDVTHSFYVERTSHAAGPDAYLVFITPTEVFDPDTMTTTDVPDDLMSWLEDNPGVEVVDGPTDVTVGGADGRQMDVRGVATDNAFLLAGIAEGEEPVRYFLAPGEPATIIVVEVDGQTVFIAGGPYDPSNYTDEAFEAIGPDIQAMIESIEFGGTTG
jgi:hypothetical protein